MENAIVTLLPHGRVSDCEEDVCYQCVFYKSLLYSPFVPKLVQVIGELGCAVVSEDGILNYSRE